MAKGENGQEQLLARVLEPILYGLDNVGNVISLTFQTLVWLVRPPFRPGQFLAAEIVGARDYDLLARPLAACYS